MATITPVRNAQTRVYLRAAAQIRERLVANTAAPAVELPDALWNECHKLSRLLTQARDRAWQAANRLLHQRLRDDLRWLRRHVDQVLATWAEPASLFVASQREIFEDLLALAEDFENVSVDLKQHKLEATTEPIELEGTYLGPFCITLNWSQLGISGCYRVLATDPQEAASNGSITHPHVNHDKLCEGEAQLPLRNALLQGRLFDFFTIVRQTLQTYNDGSAYVRLSQWLGRDCEDCGSMVGEDDAWTCPICSRTICLDCSTSCQECERDRCSECVKHCPGCDNRFCDNCLSACEGCGEDFCKECLDDDQCANCRAEQEQQRENQQQAASDEAPLNGAAVHPHGVGQIALPAGRG